MDNNRSLENVVFSEADELCRIAGDSVPTVYLCRSGLIF